MWLILFKLKKKKRTDLAQRCFPVFLPLGFHETLVFKKKGLLVPTKPHENVEKYCQRGLIELKLELLNIISRIYTKELKLNLNFQNPFQGNYLLRIVISLSNFVLQVAPKYSFSIILSFARLCFARWLQYNFTTIIDG